MIVPDNRTEYVDSPEVSETFVDSLNGVMFDGQTARIEFCVTRINKPEPPKPPSARRFPACRLALTPEAFLALFTQLQGVVASLEQQGIIQKMKQTIKEPIQ